MIELMTQVSGGQIGEQLAGDPEETWYMLVEMVDRSSRDFAEEVAEYASGHAADAVAAFLRNLAARIEQAA